MERSRGGQQREEEARVSQCTCWKGDIPSSLASQSQVLSRREMKFNTGQLARYTNLMYSLLICTKNGHQKCPTKIFRRFSRFSHLKEASLSLPSTHTQDMSCGSLHCYHCCHLNNEKRCVFRGWGRSDMENNMGKEGKSSQLSSIRGKKNKSDWIQKENVLDWVGWAGGQRGIIYPSNAKTTEEMGEELLYTPRFLILNTGK